MRRNDCPRWTGISTPLANGFFLLGVGIDSSQSFVIDFQRDDVSPPTPNNCFVQSLSYATVTASCYAYAANGTVTYDRTDAISMNRLDPAGVADDGINNSWDVPPYRPPAPRSLLWADGRGHPPS
jgi:hypothetical protein